MSEVRSIELNMPMNKKELGGQRVEERSKHLQLGVFYSLTDCLIDLDMPIGRDL